MGNKTPLAGIGYGLLAYGIWGFFPLYFRQLNDVPAIDILANRALWACICVSLILVVAKQWAKVRQVLGRPRQLAMLTLAALVITSYSIHYTKLYEGAITDISSTFQERTSHEHA